MKNLLSTFIYALITALILTGCTKEEKMMMEEEPITLEGDYNGIWRSTTQNTSFPGTVVTARLRYIDTQKTILGGEFFVSGNFTSCCDSGDNDGTLLFNLDGNTITSFKYVDIIPNCGGTFDGDGSISEDNVINVSFTGTDCDGDHIGTLEFSPRD